MEDHLNNLAASGVDINDWLNVISIQKEDGSYFFSLKPRLVSYSFMPVFSYLKVSITSGDQVVIKQGWDYVALFVCSILGVGLLLFSVSGGGEIIIANLVGLLLMILIKLYCILRLKKHVVQLLKSR
jgi:hypothetical protein